MRLNSFIKESHADLMRRIHQPHVTAGATFKDAVDMFNDATIAIKKQGLWNDTIVWRGFNSGKPNGWVVLVDNVREGFKGKIEDLVSQVIVSLNLDTQPIFATRSHSQAQFFGEPGVLIPKGNFKSYYNPNIHDIMSISPKTIVNFKDGKTIVDVRGEFDPEEVANQYIMKPNSFQSDSAKWHEIIITAKEYYIVYPRRILADVKKRKFATIRNIDAVKKYSDLVLIYNEWTSYTKWFLKMRMKEQPNLLNFYSKEYPKEWLQ